jgi:hypothetical protein
MSAKAIKIILEDAPEVRALTEQSRRLLHLQRRLQANLPASVAPHVGVGGLNAGTLTITTASGATAAKLRQLTPRLLARLQSEDREVNALKVLVQVTVAQKQLPRKKVFLSESARDALLTLSSRLESEPLRTAVARLASRSTPSGYKQESLQEINSYENQSDKDADL